MWRGRPRTRRRLEGTSALTVSHRPSLPSGRGATPVSLYKVGGVYFVLDGHHRVSVASYHGVVWIDAYVTEFGASSGLWSELRDRESA
jgi:hypothetical protein